MSDVRFVVNRYLDEGFGRPHPIPAREKGPRTGWKDPDKIFNVSDFKQDDNVGTQLTDDLVDVDLDCPEAVALADYFLPSTDRIHGRPSKPRSHFWYRIEGVADRIVYQDIPRAEPDPEHPGDTKLVVRNLLEIRTGPKFQTMLPPSQHPCGEIVAWDRDGDLGRPPAEALLEDARLLATAALLARSWPSGSRHDASLHLAGFLAARKVPQDMTERIVSKICLVTRDEEERDRLTAVATSYRKLESGDKTSGGPKLAEICGKDVLARLGKWWGKDDADIRVDGCTLTESGDADIFAIYGSETMRFHHPREQWFIIDKETHIWSPDDVGHATENAKKLMRFQKEKANQTSDPDQRKKIYLWYHAGESRSRLTNMLHLARSVSPLANRGLDWDVNPLLLGCQNGVVDLRTGELRKALPEEHISMRARVIYDPAAQCPLWLQTLAGIFAPGEEFDASGSVELISFFQRALGYSITGDCREECCFFAWGEGGNGKGTTLNTIGWLLGDYRDDMPYSTLEKAQHGSGIPSDVAKLQGKRFVTCSEVNEFRLNESRLKALTGRDPMTARFLHKDFFTFVPVAKIWLATNNRPKVTGTDDGIWRRIHLIPFLRSFKNHPNLRLKDALLLELPGILAWVVRGARSWLERELDPPPIVKAATEEYRHDSNPLTPFVDAMCVVNEKVSVQAIALWEVYQRWCQDGHVDHIFMLSDKQFHLAIRSRFGEPRVRRTHSKELKFYVGVGLRENRREYEGYLDDPPF